MNVQLCVAALDVEEQQRESYRADDPEVDACWTRLIAAGHRARTAPRQTDGPYAAMVDDPDGNVVLLTSDESARIPHLTPAS